MDSQCQSEQCHCETRKDLAWIKQHPESVHKLSPLRYRDVAVKPHAVNKAVPWFLEPGLPHVEQIMCNDRDAHKAEESRHVRRVELFSFALRQTTHG